MNEVLAILKSVYRWFVCASAEPDAATVEEALAAGQTPEAVAASLNAFALRCPPPYPGYRDESADRVFRFQLFQTFGGASHYVALNTAQALGLQPADAPTPTMPAAFTVEDVLALEMLGWERTGQNRFLELDTEQGKATFAARIEFAKNIPFSWQGVDPLLYRHLILVNRLPSVFPPFGVRVSDLYRDVYGLTFGQWIDNEADIHDGLKPRWLPSGQPAPKPAPRV